MNSNERFGQIEAMLADLLRRMDRQAEQMDRQSEQMDRQSEQVDAIIGILKISDERQTRAEERQDTMLTEMRRGFDEHSQRFDGQSKRFEEHNQRLIEQGQRTDAVLNTQMKMLELMSRQADKTDELAGRMPALAAYESRVRRLEEAVFNKAS